MYQYVAESDRLGMVWALIIGCSHSLCGQERRYDYLTKMGDRVLSEKRDEWRGFSAAVNLVTGPANTG